MASYGDSPYNDSFYGASEYREGTELRVGIKARIVKPFVQPLPIMDTLAYGLAQRFNWLQQGIQAFGLFNKIEYAKGQDLDDHWGKVYDLPRLTGESDPDYRARLQTYVKVLTGSGTIPNTQAVLDYLIGVPGARIYSLWPARAIIDFDDVTTMRQAKAKLSLLNSVLPGMFAAGVTYELVLTFMDCNVKAAIRGERTRGYSARAAVQTGRELPCGIDALVSYGRELGIDMYAAVQIDRRLPCGVRTTLRVERTLNYDQVAAIRGEPILYARIMSAILTNRDTTYAARAAIRGEPSLTCSQNAAIARTFERPCNILARIVFLYELGSTVIAAIQIKREISVGIKARIARSS